MTPSTPFTGNDAQMAPERITKDMLRALAPLPATVVQLMGLLDDPNVSIRKVSDLAGRDVGIAASILRMANSPIFGLRSQVGSISDALRVIGTVQARLLVLACGIAQTGQKALPLYGLAAGAFTKHSELVATLTATFAQESDYTNRGMAYSAGLLHDIGKVVLNGLSQRKEHSALAVNFQSKLAEPDANCVALEIAFFGKDHPGLGKELLTMWALPEEVYDAIALHHAHLEPIKGEGCLPACIALANAVAGVVDSEYPVTNRAPFPEDPISAVEPAMALAATLLRSDDGAK